MDCLRMTIREEGVRSQLTCTGGLFDTCDCMLTLSFLSFTVDSLWDCTRVSHRHWWALVFGRAEVDRACPRMQILFLVSKMTHPDWAKNYLHLFFFSIWIFLLFWYSSNAVMFAANGHFRRMLQGGDEKKTLNLCKIFWTWMTTTQDLDCRRSNAIDQSRFLL